MKSVKYIFFAAIVMAMIGATESSAKRKMVPRVYMFGFSASFTDSLVYFTNVQAVDSAWMETSKNFLLGRDNYSYQLRDYFTNEQKQPNRTCIVVFSENRKKVEKKLLKMKQKYTVKAKGKYDVRTVADTDFKFKSVDMDIQEVDDKAAEAPKTKKKKKKDRP